jgi:hypothetical protein
MITMVKLGPWNFILHGEFGREELPINLDSSKMTPEEVDHFWEQLMPVPQELAQRYWKFDNCNGVTILVADNFCK